MYLYKTTIYHNTTNVVTIPANNSADVTDFDVAGKKGTAVSVTALVVSETTFETEKTYRQFKTLVTNNTTWASVKYVDNGKAYTLYLVSSNPLT